MREYLRRIPTMTIPGLVVDLDIETNRPGNEAIGIITAHPFTRLVSAFSLFK